MAELRAYPRVRARAGATSIELSQAQLEHILRDVSGAGSFSLALEGLSDVRAVLARAQPLLALGLVERDAITRKYRITNAD